MAAHRCHINVFYSVEDKTFIADIPGLKYCSAFGDTPEEAVRQVVIAQRAWLKTAKKYGKRVRELDALTADLDQEFVGDKFHPLTAAERAQWKRTKRKPGRPRVGEGVEVVSVSIERGLLGRADKLAKKLKVSRAKLVSAGLQRVLAEAASRGAAKSKPTGGARPARRKAA